MDNTITIVVTIVPRFNFRNKIEEMLIALAEKTRLEPGNVFYRLHKSIDHPNRFIIYERWKNQEALDHHMNQDYLKGFLDLSKDLLEREISGVTCSEISEVTH